MKPFRLKDIYLLMMTVYQWNMSGNNFLLIYSPFKGDFITGVWKTWCPLVTNDYRQMIPRSSVTNAEQKGERTRRHSGFKIYFSALHHFLLHWSITKQQLPCHIQHSAWLGWWGMNWEGGKKRRHLGGEVTCDGAWSSQSAANFWQVCVTCDGEQATCNGCLGSCIRQAFCNLPNLFLCLYFTHSASLSFTQNSISIMILGGNGLTNVFMALKPKAAGTSLQQYFLWFLSCKIF